MGNKKTLLRRARNNAKKGRLEHASAYRGTRLSRDGKKMPSQNVDVNLGPQKSAAAANRSEGVYNRAGEARQTFCEKEDKAIQRLLRGIRGQQNRYVYNAMQSV